jgi:hypothetical protein
LRVFERKSIFQEVSKILVRWLSGDRRAHEQALTFQPLQRLDGLPQIDSEAVVVAVARLMLAKPQTVNEINRVHFDRPIILPRDG